RTSLRGLGSVCATAAAMGEAVMNPAKRVIATRRAGLTSQDRSMSGMLAPRRRNGCVNTHQAGVDRRKRWTATHAHIARSFCLQHFDNALHAIGAIGGQA